MAKHVDAGTSLECSKSHIEVRKLIIDNRTMIKIEGIGRCFKYKSGINSTVTITEELSPLKAVFCEESHLNLSDQLQADIIEIYTPKKIVTTLESNHSHVHGINVSDLKTYTYAKIVIPFRYVLERNSTKLIANI